MPANHDIPRTIALVERRIELRRARLQRHAHELAEAARERAKPLPLIGVVAMAIGGYMFGHRPSPTAPRRSRDASARTTLSVGVVATLLTALRAALRLGTSPLVRSVWQSYARRRV
jgi:hypothetical protein